MAESMPLDKSMTKGSDILPEIYCDPCYDVDRKILQAAGFCKNCSEYLCFDCVSAHKKQKISRSHMIEDKTSMPHKKPSPQIKSHNSITEKCNHHQGEVIQSYCRSCDQLCCKICQTIDHHACNMQSLTSAAASIKGSQQHKELQKKLNVLKKGYNDNLSKAEKHLLDNEKFYTGAIKDMRKLQEKFEKLLAETEKQAETVKDEDLKKMESVSTTCNILVEQINKISSNLDEMQDKTDSEMLFIAIKRAESQLQSLEDRLNQLDTDNTIQQYNFEPNKQLNAMLDELKALGKLCFSNTTKPAPMLKTPVLLAPMLITPVSPAPMLKTPVSPAPMLKTPVSPAPMLKIPAFIKNIDIETTLIWGSIMLPNQQLLLTDMDNNVNLIDTEKNTIVSQLALPDNPWDITQVKADEVAITRVNAKKIQFVSVTTDKISKGREMSVDGYCRGIEYNDQDDTLIVTYEGPPKVEILNLTGTVIKRFDKDANGAQLFSWPWYVALSHDKTMIYITDTDHNSMTLMTLTGDVKAVYKDKTLQRPRGVCVNRSGIVYVVGYSSYTVHQIVPGSDKLEPLLNEKNGLKKPWTITYCDVDDKLYVGQDNKNGLKVFKMKSI